jgi:hypothetical protein
MGNNRLRPLLKKFFFIPNIINEFITIHLLLESVLPEFKKYVATYIFSTL